MSVEFSEIPRLWIEPAAARIADRYQDYVDADDVRQWLLAWLYGPEGYECHLALDVYPQDVGWIQFTIMAVGLAFAEREKAASKEFIGRRVVLSNVAAFALTSGQEFE